MPNIRSLGDKKRGPGVEQSTSEKGGRAGRIKENQEGYFLDSGQHK